MEQSINYYYYDIHYYHCMRQPMLPPNSQPASQPDCGDRKSLGCHSVIVGQTASIGLPLVHYIQQLWTFHWPTTCPDVCVEQRPGTLGGQCIFKLHVTIIIKLHFLYHAKSLMRASNIFPKNPKTRWTFFTQYPPHHFHSFPCAVWCVDSPINSLRFD